MDNRKIEQNAVNAVKRAFGDVACVYAYIDENDKTECTDGHLQVYSSYSFTIETVEGQLPLQVKGTTSKRKSDRPKRQVRVSDLKHYLNIAGGCIYFYVYCGSEARSAEVFYRLLLPYDLKKILADIPEQQERISLRFDRLPSDAAELTRLVRRAVKTEQSSEQSLASPPRQSRNLRTPAFALMSASLESSCSRASRPQAWLHTGTGCISTGRAPGESCIP